MLYREYLGDSFTFFNISGCLYVLGINPRAMALRTAFAMRRWFTGRRPVSLLGLILPVSDTKSAMTEKFCQ